MTSGRSGSIVLYSHGLYLNSGEGFFIPFTRDLPKGLYQIKMTLKQEASVYLALSQVKPGFINSDDFTEKRMIRLLDRNMSFITSVRISFRRLMIFLIKMLFMLALFCSVQVYAEAPDAQFKSAFNKGRFVMPGTDELQQVRRAYRMELTGQPADDLWKALAMQRISQQDVLYLREAPGSRTGKGLFAMRGGDNAKPWLLQAPHAKSDKYTGRIAALIFSEGAFKAAMWNSVPRKTRVENSVTDMTADMAHLPGTYWQAVTEGFARHYGDGKIIQLHGYAQSKRKSAAGRDSDMIISAGHRYPPHWVQELAQCLKKKLSGNISLYPYDVKELGATTNVQGHLLQNLGFNGFLHIEMSLPMRQQLLQKPDLRQLLLSCIR